MFRRFRLYERPVAFFFARNGVSFILFGLYWTMASTVDGARVRKMLLFSYPAGSKMDCISTEDWSSLSLLYFSWLALVKSCNLVLPPAVWQNLPSFVEPAGSSSSPIFCSVTHTSSSYLIKRPSWKFGHCSKSTTHLLNCGHMNRIFPVSAS